MAEKLYPEIVVNTTTGASAAISLNKVGKDDENSIRRVSAITNVATEISYYKTGTVIYSEAENAYYRYDGTNWIVFWSLPTNNGIQFNTTPTITTPAEGLVYWNVDEGTLNVGMPGGNVNLQVGHEIIRRVYNDTGADMSNGQIVYISSSTGEKLKVSLAKADNAATCHPRTLYMVTEDIADGHYGYVTFWGDVHDVDTDGIAAGTVLYLSADTAGAYTPIPPSHPNYLCKIGGVLKEGKANGVVTMSQYLGGTLEDNNNVSFSSLQDGDLLVYNGNLWANKKASLVEGVDADYLDGHDASYFATAASISGTIDRVAKFATTSTVGDSGIADGVTAGKILTLAAVGDYTLAVPESLTAAGRDVANIFSAAQKINVNSTTGLLVEQTGVKPNVLVVDAANGRVGVNTAPVAAFDLLGTWRSGSNATDATTKLSYFTSRHYTNAEQDIMMAVVNSQVSATTVSIGGGSGSYNAATAVNIYTAADNVTTTGTRRVTVDSAGLMTAYYGLAARIDDAVTNAASTVATVAHDTSGTAAAEFGSRILWQLESSTTAGQSAAALDVVWTEATHATRKAAIRLYAYDTAQRLGVEVGANGSAPTVGLYGVTPIARPTTAYTPATFAQNSGAGVNEDSTFDGYTIGAVVAALRGIGALT